MLVFKRMMFLLACIPFAVAAQTHNHPSWSLQSVIYEVNIRQYTPEGTFNAFASSLPRLKKMGVEILWFMPINPIGVEGRKYSPSDLGSYYAVKDYNAVNPEFGTMADWISLVKKAHQMGFKVIMDWVPNHSSPDNRWITEHPDFYKKDSAGNPAIPYDWSDTRKLDYDNRGLRDTMIAAMQYWIKNSDIDGFRCDVAGDVPDDFWKEAISSLRKSKPIFMLAEGDKPSLHEDGFDETYAWNVMSIAYGIYSGKTSVKQLDSVIEHNESVFPAYSMRMYFTTNHDENSWNGTEYERFGDAYKTFAVWAFTMGKSLPMIYSGQEAANKKRLKFFVKDTIAWGDYPLQSFYQSLVSIRKKYQALAADASYKRINTSSDESVFAYFRKKGKSKVVVLINFSPKAKTFVVNTKDSYGKMIDVFSNASMTIAQGKKITLAPWQYMVVADQP